MSGETIGVAIAVLVISSFVLCMLTFLFTSMSGFFNEYKEPERMSWEKQPERTREIDFADKKALEHAHKVRTQYPPAKATETTFEITNVKESILVTETVYAD
jgi:hypothetical protein